jgi:hypothetical protein
VFMKYSGPADLWNNRKIIIDLSECHPRQIK